MRNNGPIAIIGGYDQIAKSFFFRLKKINDNTIFINVNSNINNLRNVYNFEIFHLNKILTTLEKHKIKKLLFLGKINRPNFENLKNDGEIEKYIPLLLDSYKKGDGSILSNIIKIFSSKGFKIISPKKVSNVFFFDKHDVNKIEAKEDLVDCNKSIRILNDLSKYDNAQSVVIINGYIIAIEAAEGTDNLLKRTVHVRKNLDQLHKKAGLLIKIPKKGQSKLIDLPVIGLKTLRLVRKANLNGIAIDTMHTIVHNKDKILEYAKNNNLKIYNIHK